MIDAQSIDAFEELKPFRQGGWKSVQHESPLLHRFHPQRIHHFSYEVSRHTVYTFQPHPLYQSEKEGESEERFEHFLDQRIIRFDWRPT